MGGDTLSLSDSIRQINLRGEKTFKSGRGGGLHLMASMQRKWKAALGEIALSSLHHRAGAVFRLQPNQSSGSADNLISAHRRWRAKTLSEESSRKLGELQTLDYHYYCYYFQRFCRTSEACTVTYVVWSLAGHKSNSSAVTATTERLSYHLSSVLHSTVGWLESLWSVSSDLPTDTLLISPGDSARRSVVSCWSLLCTSPSSRWGPDTRKNSILAGGSF